MYFLSLQRTNFRLKNSKVTRLKLNSWYVVELRFKEKQLIETVACNPPRKLASALECEAVMLSKNVLLGNYAATQKCILQTLDYLQFVVILLLYKQHMLNQF